MANNPNCWATNVIRLNRTHSFLNLQQNSSNKKFVFPFVLWQNSSELRKFCAIRHVVRESREIRTIC